MRAVQRWVCLVLLWSILWTAGIDLEGPLSWVLWTVPLLFLAIEHLAHVQGVVRGFEIYHSMTDEQRKQVTKLMDKDS
jgi:cytochrome c-type biogenesis protein CcmH/NrfF